jgi:Tfp pilus assembly protein PilN
MKHDINLLQRKKVAQYSGKKLGTVLLFVLLFAALLYAGITLPSNSLTSAQIRLADLNNQIADQSTIDQELTEKTQHNATLQEELKQLEALSVTRQDVAKYMEAVESSLPTSASIMSLTISDNAMTITGISPRDEVLATFALRLRQTQAFTSVFVASSTTTGTNSSTMFMISAVLPTPLSDTANVTDGSDSADQSNSDDADKADSGDNSNDSGNKPDSGDATIAEGEADTVASVDSADNGEANQ